MTNMHVTPKNIEYAEQLTKRIKVAGEELAELLAEARDGKWWAVLGYKTWNAYVEDRFDFGRNYANKLISGHRVVAELRAGVGTDVPTNGDVHLTEGAARAIKGKVPEVIEHAQAQVAQGVEPAEAMRAAVSAARQPIVFVQHEEPPEDELPVRVLCEHEYVCRHCGESA